MSDEASSVDLTPGVEYLIGLANANHDHYKVLGEAIDNAFDAGGTIISISVTGGKRLEIQDNGLGCANLEVMASLGRRESHRTTKLHLETRRPRRW